MNTENLNLDIDTVKNSAPKRVPTWVRWIPACVLVALLYFVSVGPAFRLHGQGRLSSKALLIYKPLISIHSPLFEVTREYLVEYPG